MNLQQRLTKLEELTSEGQPVVVWMNPSETQEEARNKAGVKDNQTVIFVRWLSYGERSSCEPTSKCQRSSLWQTNFDTVADRQ